MRSLAALRVAAPLVACLACMPQERVNRSCEWRNDSVVLTPPGTRERHLHLSEDVRVAQDLGIRHGDSVGGRHFYAANVDARTACTEASFEQIMRQHQVSRAELVAVTGAREYWADALLVIIPMLLLFLAVSRYVVRRIAVGYDTDDRWILVLILAVLTPIAAGVGVGFAQIWAVLVEEARLRSDHISYRAAYLPLYVYKELAWLTAGALFVAIAALVVRDRHALDRGRATIRFTGGPTTELR